MHSLLVVFGLFGMGGVAAAGGPDPDEATSGAPASTAPVQLLPGAPLVIGQPGTIELWAPDLGADARLSGRSDLARVGSATPAGDGRWLLPITPTDGQGEITVLLTLRDGHGRARWPLSVPVQAATMGALAVDAGDGAVVHGEVDSREIHVRPLGSSPLPPARRHLLARARLGRVEAIEPTADGWSLRWRAPERLDGPDWEIVTVADATAPTTVLGWAALPLSFPTEVTAEVPPGVACTLTAGETESAPTTADDGGRVRLTIDLPPGVTRGELRCTADGEALRRTLPLPGGLGPSVALLPLPPRLPAGATVPVQAVVLEDDGAPRSAGSGPEVDGAGELALVAAGIFTGSWTAPAGRGRARIRATLRDATDETVVDIVTPGGTSTLPASRVVAWAQPNAVERTVVDAGDASVVVLASALDAAGLAVPRAVFTPTARQARLRRDRVVAGRDGRAAVRLHVEPGARAPGLSLDTGGFSDTAAIVVGPTAPAPGAGTGPDDLRQARAALAAGRPVSPALPPVNTATARAAAGDPLALARVDRAPTRAAQAPPRLRLAVSAGSVPHTYRQSAVEGDQGIPGQVDNRQGDLFAGDPLGGAGAELRLQFMPPALPLGADLRLRARPEHYVIVGTDFDRFDLQLAAGLRAPAPPLARATPFLVAHAVGFRVPLFSYDYFREDEPSKAAGARMITTTVLGGSLGGGVDLDLGETLVDLELTETFAPWPIDTRLGAAVETAVIDSLALRAAVDLSFRSMLFDLGADRVRIFEQQHQLLLGLVYLGR